MSGILKRLREIDYESLSSIKPSTTLITLITIAISIFFFGGGLYNIMEQSMARTRAGNPGYYPDIAIQFLTESISFIFFLIIGISGGYISFRSTRYAYRPREAKMFLTIGVSMLIVAVIGSEVALMAKLR